MRPPGRQAAGKASRRGGSPQGKAAGEGQRGSKPQPRRQKLMPNKPPKKKPSEERELVRNKTLKLKNTFSEKKTLKEDSLA